MEQCQARDYCKFYKSDRCNEYCGINSLLQAIYSLSNIPLKYQYSKQLKAAKQDIKAFTKLSEYMEDIENVVSEGKGLYIWSEVTGNGKTSWATRIANQYIRKCVFKGKIENVATYINVPTYLERIRQSYSNSDNGLIELNNQILNSDLVIFDDIGAEKPSEWVQEQLYRIINHRDNNLKSTIYTSNVNPETLRYNLGERNYSRIINANEVIQIKGGDRR